MNTRAYSILLIAWLMAYGLVGATIYLAITSNPAGFFIGTGTALYMLGVMSVDLTKLK